MSDAHHISGNVHVRRFESGDELARAAAAAFVETVIAAQRDRGHAAVVLTGGGTGIAVLDAVLRAPGGIDWSAVDVYFGDERYLPPGDPERNEVQARAALLDHVPLDPARVHAMPTLDEAGAGSPESAARTYAQVLAANSPDGSTPEFDVHLLGMGGEGHVNSLFPHTDAVREQDRFVVGVDDSPKPPAARVTLTLPAVRRARQVWLLVTGAAKAEAVAAAVGGADAVDVPAAGARGRDRTVWFLDTEAAAALPAG
ncbi:6-phosphogluconolactonase [Rhodococcus sp. CSLK01-03]|uniref:6-phosphogluconolactonase n=1 Tax=Rhodococcus indonesiensis TaxID=3055869 RepID=A0ABT7RR91_9NOCA|nr:6-phosphogluconolactonase [Rhodococcus indonesiensis]MDM7490160.1 6-phosphogluconolactonase [Rhodococcus indonesiensis]